MPFRSLILVGIVQGFFLILLIGRKREKSYSDMLLMTWLAIVSSLLLFYYDNFSVHPIASHPIQILGFSLPLLSSPIFYLYIKSLTANYPFCFKKTWIHILVYSIFNLLVLSLYALDSTNITTSNGILHFGRNIPEFANYLTGILIGSVSGGYQIAGLIVLLKYQKSLPNSYSNTEKITLNWLKWLVILAFIVFIILFVIIRFRQTIPIYSNHIFTIVGFVLTVYIFLVGYLGLGQTSVFINSPSSIKTEQILAKEPYKNSKFDELASKIILEKLNKYVAEKKPYLDENINLSELARQINVTPNQLSQIINQGTSSNFYTFINTYRVEAVKLKLKDPACSQYTLLAIAFECGFCSKASFNKIFKEMVGMTPSQFQKS